MVFSSPTFLFGFLPITLLLYYLSPKVFKNIVLLTMSLFFYAWGEVFYLGVMAISIISNYLIGRAIYRAKKNTSPTISRGYITIGVLVNLALLISFKYANFIVDNITLGLNSFGVSGYDLAPIHLPLGISFFTFQAISYIVDVYRGGLPAQRNIFNLALYISLFPQLIAGPIVRYHDVATQILERKHSVSLFSSGVQRFILGLAKKMLIANPLGEVADNIFALTGNDLTMPLAWIGILSYTLQIYFDFSGYSDMAIGLGRMFGFRFLENFNYPYIARSLREFWKRWHISLSNWFKDYVYIPLGGNRVSTHRVYLNLFLVFFLTGIWHGASWNFIVWGMFHGVFLASEHMGFSKVLNKVWKPVQHFYLLMVIIVSWVFFRSETLTQAVSYLGIMADLTKWNTTEFQYNQVLIDGYIYTFVIGLVLSLPIYNRVKDFFVFSSQNSNLMLVTLLQISRVLFLAMILFLSILKIASSTYNPFIYFRF